MRSIKEMNKRLDEREQEIERLNEENEELKKIQCTFLGTGCKAEIERLHSIIKEVREYIEKTKFKYCDDELCYMIENHYNNILEILDKENK